MSHSTETILSLSTDIVDVLYSPADQILYSRFKIEQIITVDHIKQLIKTEMELVQGERHAQIISFNSGFISPTAEARKYAASILNEINRVSTACIIEHLPVMLIVNSFIVFNKPSIPFKMFSNIEDAQRWSLEQLRNNT